MCGFVGLMRDHHGADSSEADLHSMVDVIRHRGPDDVGYYTDETVMLGFRRLSIIDIEQGHQPLSDADGRYWIVFNGEIYNYIELRERLRDRGHHFQTSSDTEVILALFKEKQEKAVHDLRGMFAFVIYDRQTQTLFGARDPFGIKPFYYLETENVFYVASEAKSLLASVQEAALNQEALQDYLTYQYVPEPMSMVPNIRKLQPGHFFWKKTGQPLVMHEYWKPIFSPVKKSQDQLAHDIRKVLQDSVAVHMRSDVPVGAFLSGGIDSTCITALAKEINPHLKTFTVGFEQPGFSEVDVAAQTAEALGVEHHTYVISPEEFVQELPRIIWHMDDPVADPAAIPLYFVAREASKQVKVVLSGEGADELFGGYGIYREPLSLRYISALPAAMRRILKHIALSLPDQIKGKNYILRGCTPQEERYIGNAKLFEETEKRELLKRYCAEYVYSRLTNPLYQQVAGYDPVTQMQYIDLHTWLRGDILAKADRMSMAHSLELRVPFLDRQVFMVAAKLHAELKVTRQTTKHLLREAMKGIVPEHILHRPKLGFPVPLRHWLKDELFDWAWSLIRESETDHLLNKEYVLKQLETHREGSFDQSVRQRWVSHKGKGDLSRYLWAVLVFMIWHQIFIEKKFSFTADHDTIDSMVHVG
ncbi:asparagine synthase (glutamine-hydrolyzing) [Caldalkalibacillus uzonensis]|uniref:asparagine synthase (glutamine-hydrolyzing) n=1 Tax=Caldalkalibacillus uzonensis TaxID=353224 RepID=A0ABU0CNT7_9BACI|nr:asparagine synthase (glutamine-hydrolyzing) [Caldalkalibacillus uzonensis]MDQ0338080.1 asparagine synthase (glutamine-hydrolyzing) [Caldalkalibacillus uzonensis]